MQFTGPRHDHLHRSSRESDELPLREPDKERNASSDDKTPRRQLYQALEAHRFGLEIRRSVACGLDRKILDRRVEAAQRLLEWLSQALELANPAAPAVQKPPLSSTLTDQNQTPVSTRDPPKTSRG